MHMLVHVILWFQSLNWYRETVLIDLKDLCIYVFRSMTTYISLGLSD